MSLKIWSNLGLAKKMSKSKYVGPLLVNHAESNFSNFAGEIGLCGHFYSDLRICFFYVGIFFTGFLKANQTEYSQARSSWVHASEATPRVSEPSESRKSSKPSKSRMVNVSEASQAVFASRERKAN